MQSPSPTETYMKYYFKLLEDEYNPKGRRDLTPIFELVKIFDLPPTPPNTPVKQKSYYGKKRLIKADI